MAGLLCLTAIILFLMVPAGISAQEQDDTSADTGINQTKALAAVYIIGSDLETEDNEATKAITDFVHAYKETSPEDFTVLVAYGGSKKPGWEGMTVETLPQLKDDLADGEVGNDQDFELRDPDVNMGSPEALTEFLIFVREHTAANTSYLIFSDHGGGWEGFGSDENHDDSGLVLTDFSASLASSGFSPDLIGFDACLMSTIEVAKTLSPHTGLLLGSEELEPGDGWKNDEWIAMIAENPVVSPEEVGKAIIDGYMEREDSEKTLSLLDTTKTADVTAALEAFSSSLPADEETTRTLATVYRDQKFFGGESSTSVDLVTLSGSLAEAFPDQADAAKTIGEKAREMVIYERHDADRSYANGVSIMSVEDVSPDRYAQAEESVSLAPSWDQQYQALISLITESISKIALTVTEDGRYALEDPSGYATVEHALYRISGDDIWFIGTIPAEPDEDGLYQPMEWDGQWYYITDTASGEILSVPSFETIEEYDDGTSLLSAAVTIQGRTAFLEIIADREYIEETEILPYTTTQDGNMMFGSSYPPDIGDVITTDTPGEPEPESVTWSEGTKVGYGILPDGEYAVGFWTGGEEGEEDYVIDTAYSIADGQISPLSP